MVMRASVEVPEGLQGFVRCGGPLWRRTSIRVGGPAALYGTPRSAEDVNRILAWARGADLSVAILGGGTNVVFSDAGYEGLVLDTTGLGGRRAEGVRLIAGAGESLSKLAWWACSLGLSGLEWGCGIPGTVGGAVVMNAGTKDGETASVLTDVRLATGEMTLNLSADELHLGYRTSALRDGRLRGVILEATFQLEERPAEECLKTARRILDERIRRLPRGATVGCIFRNPPSGPTAGQLLDHAGCKEMRVGLARVSKEHANVVVNDGIDNAADVLDLIRRMRERVLEKFGVELREEVVILG